MGVELEVFTQPLYNVSVNGFLSLGNWQYKGNATQRTFNENGTQIGSDLEIEIDGFNVGGAAQVNAGINASWEFLTRLSVDAGWNWYNDMYSTGSLADPTIAMPSYDLVNAGLSYQMFVGKNDKNSLQFRININNVFDEVYLESVNGNEAVNATDGNYKGVNTENTGRFGYGRTWNTSMRFNF
jgi:outer membrane receptor for monomeric catechols